MEDITESSVSEPGRLNDRRVPWQQWKQTDDTQKLQANQYLLETARVDDAISELLSMMNWMEFKLTNLEDCRGKLQRKERVTRIRSTVQVVNHPLLALLYIASDRAFLSPIHGGQVPMAANLQYSTTKTLMPSLHE